MDQVQVIISLDRYNELLLAETNLNRGAEVEVIADEDISDALQSIFVAGNNISTTKYLTGVDISMRDHPINTDPLAKTHRFKKLLVITKIKKPNEGNISSDNTGLKK